MPGNRGKPGRAHAAMTADGDQPPSAISAVLALPPHSRVLLVGAADTGKTTLAAAIVRLLAQSGKLPLAVVDGDIGQSEIGPPGTVGLGALTPDAEHAAIGAGLRSLSRIPAVAGAFVGALSPQGSGLETASAIIQMAQSAALLTPRPLCTLIDTPGHITGAGAAVLRTLIDIIRPHLVIALARGAELDPILRPFEIAGNVHRQQIAEGVGRKTASVRATRRAARFAQHLSGARPIHLTWEQSDVGTAQTVVLERTMLSYGRPLPPHELKFIGQTLGDLCAYAERLPSGDLLAIMSGPNMQSRQEPAQSKQIGVLEQSLGVRRVVLETESRYTGLLCGLHTAKGDLLGIGLVSGIDFPRRAVSILTPVRAAAVARLAFGSVRLRPDGRELTERD